MPKFFIKTYGCQMNVYDSERMADVLRPLGYGVTDRVEDTVDYGDVCQQVALAAQERSYKTLERLCSAVADRLMDRYGADAVSVRAAKPEPPIALPVDEVSVEVWKERSED